MDAETSRSLELFIERMKTMREGPPDSASSPRVQRPRLAVVTDANVGQFKQPAKRRAPKAKAQLGGNVVAFRRPELVPPSDSAETRARDEVCRRFSGFVDRLEALTKREAERKAAQRTKGEDPKGAA